MTVKKTEKPKKSLAHIVLYFYMILMLLIMLTVASYTWFSLSQTPRVSNMAMYINSPSGMDISLSPSRGEWVKQLSYVDMVPETSPLRPVTWSEEEQRFYGAVYGMDGRLTGDWIPLSDERNANRDHYESYYCIGTFYAHSDETVKVSLTPAMAVEEGDVSGSGTYVIGTPVWNPKTVSHDNGGKGAEFAVRVGIRVYRLDEQYQPLEEEPLFYIYEPNGDRHVSGVEGYATTPGIDGTDTLIDATRIFPQTATVWTETFPAQKNKQVYTFGDFETGTDMFILKENETVMIRIYIWLEGQDVDCTNAIADARITANIQFLAQSYHDSGMSPVETETTPPKTEPSTDPVP